MATENEKKATHGILKTLGQAAVAVFCALFLIGVAVEVRQSLTGLTPAGTQSNTETYDNAQPKNEPYEILIMGSSREFTGQITVLNNLGTNGSVSTPPAYENRFRYSVFLGGREVRDYGFTIRTQNPPASFTVGTHVTQTKVNFLPLSLYVDPKSCEPALFAGGDQEFTIRANRGAGKIKGCKPAP